MKLMTRGLADFTLLATLAFLAGFATAEPYRLGVGDEISISHNGAVDPVTLNIDMDGHVRLATIGGVPVAGLSADAAEAEIANQLAAQGFFVDPIVSLTVQQYAPVIVGGDVTRPGRYEYLPGMTVAAALALSGGQHGSGLSQTEIDRARADAQAALQTAAYEIALATARLARFEAALSGTDLTTTLRNAPDPRIPDTVAVASILRKEADILAGDRARAAHLVAFWEDEIATIEAQATNLDARVAVQQEIVASTLANLQTSQDLSERGLQTAARLSVAEQRAADARARVLELEAAKMAAARALSTAQRERVIFLANRERETLIGLQEASRDLETATYRQQRAKDHLTALAGLAAGGAADPDAVKLSFELQTARQGRPSGAEITSSTLLLPGEVLIVSTVPLAMVLDG